MLLLDMTAVAMAWGAINEWTTQAGYGRLAVRSGHPLLAELLRRTCDKRVGISTFTPAKSPAPVVSVAPYATIARIALRKCWHPVGTGVVCHPLPVRG